MKIDWQVAPDYLRFLVWKQTPKYGVKTAIIITGVKIASAFVFLAIAGISFAGGFMPTTDEVKNKPLNSPSYDSVAHRQAASELCAAETGHIGLVRAGKVVAGHVVVVRLDGVMERMDTTEAWDRAESKTRADDIWVVGVCKADVVGLKDVKA